MDWLHSFQLFLFDFDGLLVNTEHLHYQAYLKMCRDRGHTLDWDFPTYCMAAHYDAEKLRSEIYRALPELEEQEPDWATLYREKTENILQLLKKGAVELMPGAKELLVALENQGIKRCVVTNSSREQIDLILSEHPILQTIPYWFTRETYTLPKPHPESYRNAIASLCDRGEQVIGFEDTPRGLQALRRTRAKPVLITEVRYPEVMRFLEQGVVVYSTLLDLPNQLPVVH